MFVFGVLVRWWVGGYSDGKGAATAIYIGAGGAFLAGVLCVGLRETRGVEDADAEPGEGGLANE